MKKLIVYLCYCALPLFSFSQSELVTKTTSLIAEGKYTEATQYLDAALQQNPKNVDALMMKGNVLLNYSLSQTPPPFVVYPNDENIFTPGLAEGYHLPRILALSVAQRVESMWRKCLQLDPSRNDVRMGLCTVYGMAGMKKELLNELPKLRAGANGKGNDFAYIMASYAKLLKERGDFAGCIEVYDKIISLYPNFGGIISDKAAEYYLRSDFEHAKKYIEQAMAQPLPDATAIANAIDIYTATGETDKALLVFYEAAKQPWFMEYGYYKALYQYSIGQPTWRNELFTYESSMAGKQDTVAQKIAGYMNSKTFQNTYADYLTLLSFQPNEYVVQLLSQGAMRQFPDSLVPKLIFAETFLNRNNFTLANEKFAALENEKMSDALRQDFTLQYAYSLYRAGHWEKSLAKWNLLLISQVPFLKTCATYFSARCYQKLNELAKAKLLFEQLAKSQDDSKYAYLAEQILAHDFPQK